MSELGKNDLELNILLTSAGTGCNDEFWGKEEVVGLQRVTGFLLNVSRGQSPVHFVVREFLDPYEQRPFRY